VEEGHKKTFKKGGGRGHLQRFKRRGSLRGVYACRRGKDLLYLDEEKEESYTQSAHLSALLLGPMSMAKGGKRGGGREEEVRGGRGERRVSSDRKGLPEGYATKGIEGLLR